jgi:ADP-ribose pyrophosphatase YjhB (NUDIX family)
MTYLSPKLFKTMTDNIPITCIDLIPVRRLGDKWQIGIITRATGPEVGKPAILGGRIFYEETILQAILRHMKTDWEVSQYTFFSGNKVSRPFYVQQYLHQKSAKSPFGYDPTKHAISLTYLIQIAEEPRPRNEASDFYWIDRQELPESSAYNQHLVMELAFDELIKKS